MPEDEFLRSIRRGLREGRQTVQPQPAQVHAEPVPDFSPSRNLYVVALPLNATENAFMLVNTERLIVSHPEHSIDSLVVAGYQEPTHNDIARGVSNALETMIELYPGNRTTPIGERIKDKAIGWGGLAATIIPEDLIPFKAGHYTKEWLRWFAKIGGWTGAVVGGTGGVLLYGGAGVFIAIPGAAVGAGLGYISPGIYGAVRLSRAKHKREKVERLNGRDEYMKEGLQRIIPKVRYQEVPLRFYQIPELQTDNLAGYMADFDDNFRQPATGRDITPVWARDGIKALIDSPNAGRVNYNLMRYYRQKARR